MIYVYKLFVEEEIDIFTMKELTPELLKELIPTLGSRIRFLKKWKETFTPNNLNQELLTSNLTIYDKHSNETNVAPVAAVIKDSEVNVFTHYA